jgi:hypothetical protein
VSTKVKTAPVQRVGPCGVAQGCLRKCEGWAPHPTYSDVWQTCWCGHSRGVHAIDLPPPPPEPEPEPEPESDVIQVVMIESVRVLFEQWLAQRGLLLGRIPDTDPDDLPTYIVTFEETP